MSKIYTCRCGEMGGQDHCQWTGEASELVVVEWMPEHLRASHRAAGNSGSYPHNGAARLAIQYDCYEMQAEYEGEDSEFFRRLDGADVEHYAERVDAA